MFKQFCAIAAFAAMVAMSGAASAQNTSPPAACQTASAPMAGMDHSTMAHDEPVADNAHAALMAGMDTMNTDMMAGAQAPDIDVAFACAMLAHHVGAVDMAKAELAHGKNDWTRQMAQKIIDAQTTEIAEFTNWLNDQPK